MMGAPNPLALALLRGWLTTSAGRAYLDTWHRQAEGWADTACSLAERYEITLPTVLRETRSAAASLHPTQAGGAPRRK